MLSYRHLIAKIQIKHKKVSKGMHEHSPAKASDDHEQEHVAELLAEVIDKIDNLATEEAPSYLDREGVPVKGGRFHHLPDYDGRESPFVAETLIRASVYTKDDEPVIRTIGTSFYASPDRGTMGYEIYEDGRVSHLLIAR